MLDKDKRDAMYADLRKNGDELERQVVRFSSCEAILDDENLAEIDDKYRVKYRQTWSVAYPRS